MSKKIYLAIPYTGTEEESFKQVNIVAVGLMNQGHIVFSPISQNHPIAKEGKLPTEWEFWQQQDAAFIHWCDEIHVVIKGKWWNSVGVSAETDMAKKFGKKIVQIDCPIITPSLKKTPWEKMRNIAVSCGCNTEEVDVIIDSLKKR